MKRSTVYILRTLLVLAALAGCAVLALHFGGFFGPEPGIGLVRPADGTPYMDEARLKEAALAAEVPLTAADSDNGVAAAARQLVEGGARVLILSLEGELDTEEFEPLRQLTQEGVTLLFAGHNPGENFLESCEDLAWFVGSDTALAGELLGQQAAMLYRDGLAPDLNEDILLQFAWLADEEAADKAELLSYTLLGCEHYGVYSNEMSSVQGPAEELEALATAEWAPLDPRPEILLTSNAAAARAALAAREALGWGEIPVSALAANLDEAEALADEGVQALCYYDLKDATDTLALLAANALEQQAITDSTDLAPVDHAFLLPYLPYEF